MTSIILAAGRGRRLGAGVPKCLIEIDGISILKRQIAAMRATGIEHFVVVVGYEQEQVRAHLADDPGSFEFLVNERFAETNTIYSLYLARAHFGRGFLYTNGDVLFDRRLPQLLLSDTVATDATVLAIKPGRCGQEEVKAIVQDGRIVRIGKQLDPAYALGEFIGVARFGSGMVNAFAEMLTHCVEIEGIVGDHFEQAVDRLCIADRRILPMDIGHLPCCEIDFPEDLRYAIAEVGPQLIRNCVDTNP